ncbi:MAG: carbamoyltransferase HypF [Deinococcota bacterium]
MTPEARFVVVRGTVQGVGFRPFVFRLASQHGLTGWVRNDDDGVKIWLEGDQNALTSFLEALPQQLPPAAIVAKIEVDVQDLQDFPSFEIVASEHQSGPSTRISADLTICPDCLAELRDPTDRRYQYPYINCTNCGPRYTIITGLPYDRPKTTMHAWPMCEDCQAEYDNPLNRRFHAQPVACPKCGPTYNLALADDTSTFIATGTEAITQTATLLREGHIVAIKGLGGYHLACDARNAAAVETLRARKFRKDKAFAVMVADVDHITPFVEITSASAEQLHSTARPIVLLPKTSAADALVGVAPDNDYLGVMLAYTPLHYLLFDLGAPDVLVMTSANRSSEPIAYEDDDAKTRLAGLADAFLIGERPIARRVDDSVIKPIADVFVPLRRARGYAPAAVTTLPTKTPLLAVGADLKNSVTLVVEGQAFVSQYIGDLEHYGAFQAFEETIHDLTTMYAVNLAEAVVAYDAHPSYRSQQAALELPALTHIPIQHHRAHIAAVLAEHQAWDTRVLGIAFDGTGYGDDPAVSTAIWGGEFFAGSVRTGFERVSHLHYATLPGGDAAAKYPVQAAAGFLHGLDVPNLTEPPFNFPKRYLQAQDLVAKNVQCYPTSSAGRLFDTVAALLGFTQEMTFEGQAAMWLETLAQTTSPHDYYPVPLVNGVLDYLPLLDGLIHARQQGKQPANLAASFHHSLAKGMADAALSICDEYELDTIVLSGGVFQNGLLTSLLVEILTAKGKHVWLHTKVPPNDGGISLGQAALAALQVSFG